MTAPAQNLVSTAASLAAAVPPGLTSLTPKDMVDLRRATAQLLKVGGESGRAELARFQDVRHRALAVDTCSLRDLHAGRTILVTGGTGCIGSALVRELDGLGARCIISVSRGREHRWPRFPGVEYLRVDLRDRHAVLSLIATLRPDIVYHLAAQHDPGLAEREVRGTVSSNASGTINVADACRLVPGVRLACASTGKAVRPFSRDVYAASKKMTEWILRQAARDEGLSISAVRFTHVVDNSIILQRLQDWSRLGAAIRLHCVDSMFYLQSALEAAQLLMSSTLDATPGVLALGAIRDLGWPTSLLDLALGVISTSPTESPVYVCGYEAGYEKAPYPALYDPTNSGSRSPLFNSLEAPEVTDSGWCPDVDLLRPPSSADDRISALIRSTGAHAVSGAASEIVRALSEECGWAMLRETLKLSPAAVLNRHATFLATRTLQMFSDDDIRIYDMVSEEVRQRATTSDDMIDGRRRKSA